MREPGRLEIAELDVEEPRADEVLVITLELGQYWPRQKGLSLSKEVRLGTGYSASVPWLTSLEKPVAVVQLTGALVGRDGRAIRIGAEGLMAKRSNIVLSSIGGQMLISDEDIEKLRTLRRDDLPGQLRLRRSFRRRTPEARRPGRHQPPGRGAGLRRRP